VRARFSIGPAATADAGLRTAEAAVAMSAGAGRVIRRFRPNTITSLATTPCRVRLGTSTSSEITSHAGEAMSTASRRKAASPDTGQAAAAVVVDEIEALITPKRRKES
tara:strand:+ start:2530 stop:2853 length:324 start_codon:yes stop_codon:yes gene_type:complete